MHAPAAAAAEDEGVAVCLNPAWNICCFGMHRPRLARLRSAPALVCSMAAPTLLASIALLAFVIVVHAIHRDAVHQTAGLLPANDPAYDTMEVGIEDSLALVAQDADRMYLRDQCAALNQSRVRTRGGCSFSQDEFNLRRISGADDTIFLIFFGVASVLFILASINSIYRARKDPHDAGSVLMGCGLWFIGLVTLSLWIGLLATYWPQPDEALCTPAQSRPGAYFTTTGFAACVIPCVDNDLARMISILQQAHVPGNGGFVHLLTVRQGDRFFGGDMYIGYTVLKDSPRTQHNHVAQGAATVRMILVTYPILLLAILGLGTALGYKYAKRLAEDDQRVQALSPRPLHPPPPASINAVAPAPRRTLDYEISMRQHAKTTFTRVEIATIMLQAFDAISRRHDGTATLKRRYVAYAGSVYLDPELKLTFPEVLVSVHPASALRYCGELLFALVTLTSTWNPKQLMVATGTLEFRYYRQTINELLSANDHADACDIINEMRSRMAADLLVAPLIESKAEGKMEETKMVQIVVPG